MLLVDAAPQGSWSQGFLGSELTEGLSSDETLAGAFAGPAHAVRTTSIPAIDVVSANHHLTAFNTPHPERLGLEQFALAQILEELPEYDLRLIDCPPNLYRCSWSALPASDFVIVPVPPEDFAAQGLRVVHQAIDQAQRLNSRLTLLGHLVTRVDNRLVVYRTYECRL